jgi:hypothetical protein
MRFFPTVVRATGIRILINLEHVENVYSDDQGAVFVMLPIGDKRPRVFETDRSFEDTSTHLLKEASDG